MVSGKWSGNQTVATNATCGRGTQTVYKRVFVVCSEVKSTVLFQTRRQIA